MLYQVQTEPEYSPSNPKIDLYRVDGTYWGSTHGFRTVRDALQYFNAQHPDERLTLAKIDKGT